MISQVFWTHDRKWAFQRIDDHFRVYNRFGEFKQEFMDFWKMCEWIKDQNRGM